MRRPSGLASALAGENSSPLRTNTLSLLLPRLCPASSPSATMKSLTALLLALAAAAPAALASPAAAPAAAPAPTPAPSPQEVERAIEARAATCTFSGSLGYSSASKSKSACSTIILNSLAVPAGVTLDMTGLPADTVVIFEGETTFGYKEWEGPLFAVSGDSVKVAGTTGAVLNGNGPVSLTSGRAGAEFTISKAGVLTSKQNSRAIGMARAATVARRSRSSSKPTT